MECNSACASKPAVHLRAQHLNISRLHPHGMQATRLLRGIAGSDRSIANVVNRVASCDKCGLLHTHLQMCTTAWRPHEQHGKHMPQETCKNLHRRDRLFTSCC